MMKFGKGRAGFKDARKLEVVKNLSKKKRCSTSGTPAKVKNRPA